MNTDGAPAAPHRIQCRIARIGLALALGVTVLASTALRLHGIDHNYPYTLYVDEAYVAHRAMEMYRDRTLDPGRYDYNPLLMTAVDAAMRAVVAVRGDDPAAFRQSIKYEAAGRHRLDRGDQVVAAQQLIDPPIFLLVGRAVVAVAGGLAVLVLYLALRELFPAWMALLGAALLGTIPELAEYSHFLVNDVPMTLTGCLVLWASARWRRTASGWDLLLAGACAGLTVGFKTTGILALGLPLLVVVLSERSASAKLRAGVLLAAAAVVAFYASCPGMLGHLRAQIENLRVQERFYAHQYEAIGSHLDYVRRLLSAREMGMLGMLLAAAGLIAAVLERRDRRFLVAVACYALAYLAFFSRYTFQPPRSLLPLLPSLIVLALHGARSLPGLLLARRPRLATLASGAALVALLAITTVHTWSEHRLFLSRTDSRIRVSAWLERHARAGERVAIADTVVFHPLAIASAGLDLAFLDVAERERFLAADWVVLPQFAAGALESQRKAAYDALTEALVHGGRRPLFVAGSKPQRSEHGYTGPTGRLTVYGPPRRHA